MPTPVRSKPELTFPPCPTCGKPVEYTLTFEARALAPITVADQYADKAPEPGDPHRTIMWVGDTVPDGRVDVGGAPDRDMVEAFPCTCVQHGAVAHRFLLDAINLTYPDVHVEIRLTIPAELAGGPTPVHLASTTRLDPDDVHQQQGAGLNPIELSLHAGVEQVYAGLPEGLR